MIVAEFIRTKSEGGSQVVVGDYMVANVDAEGALVRIDPCQGTLKILDLSKLEVDGPTFGLLRAENPKNESG